MKKSLPNRKQNEQNNQVSKKKSWVRIILYFFCGTILCIGIGGAVIRLLYQKNCVPIHTNEPAVQFSETPTPQSVRLKQQYPYYKRSEDNSFLSLPEWYIVFSAQEYADFIKDKNPSDFPFLTSVKNYWQYYCSIYSYTTPRYPVNPDGYDLGLSVIGTSYSVEYLLKGLYETTIGRLSEMLGEKTDEDHYAYAVQNEYAQFLHLIPFYEFPFLEKYKDLWNTTSLVGPNMVRKLERKNSLSTMYIVNGVYGTLIRKATKTIYPSELLMTMSIVQAPKEALLLSDSRIEIKEELESGVFLITTPRYEPFTVIAQSLADRHVQFLEIAGNTRIMATAVVPKRNPIVELQPSILFRVSIATQPDFERIVLSLPVQQLSDTIRILKAANQNIEHIYDY